MGRWGGTWPPGAESQATDTPASGERAFSGKASGAHGISGQAVDAPEFSGRASTDEPGLPATQTSPVAPGPDKPAPPYASQPRGFAERAVITASGVRQPIVAILLLISFFTVISGKPLDGLLMVVVATALAWEAGIRARDMRAARALATEGVLQDQADQSAQHSAWRVRPGPPRLRHVVLGIAAAFVYSLTVGSFTRYSWPVTAGVVGLGAGVVLVGWGGPTRKRAIPARFARHGMLLWGSLLVAGGLWELTALLEQPNIEQSSWAHPTISTLTDPLLSTSFGRSVALLGWIGLGAFLVER